MRRIRNILVSALGVIAVLSAAAALLLRSYREQKFYAEQFSLSSPEEILNMPFQIYFMDVGEADAALVVSGSHAMLIDGGNVDDGPLVVSFLQQCGIKGLDYMVASHPHEDHIGGLGSVLESIPAKVILSPVDELPKNDPSLAEHTGSDMQTEDTASYNSEDALSISAYDIFRRKVRSSGRSITVPAAGDMYTLGDAAFEILGPVSYDTGGSLNNLSLILRITYGNHAFLFTGDAEYDELQSLLDAGLSPDSLKSDVLKVSHHGSTDAANMSFLEAVSPSCAVISVGADNTHFHPTEKILRMLEDIGAHILRTDLDGTICVTSDGTGLYYYTANAGK